jgi:DNA-binding NtrC family response regulator
VAENRDKRVFVVDDEWVIAQTLAAILQNAGFQATAFNNPLEALHAAGREAPDLVISDVVMPQLSGIELALRMKILYPACKIMLFSGQAETSNLLSDARDQGHDFYLMTKPVHPLDMLRQIREQTEPITTA